jgi:hypothetical protein
MLLFLVLEVLLFLFAEPESHMLAAVFVDAQPSWWRIFLRCLHLQRCLSTRVGPEIMRMRAASFFVEWLQVFFIFSILFSCMNGVLGVRDSVMAGLLAHPAFFLY